MTTLHRLCLSVTHVAYPVVTDLRLCPVNHWSQLFSNVWSFPLSALFLHTHTHTVHGLKLCLNWDSSVKTLTCSTLCTVCTYMRSGNISIGLCYLKLNMDVVHLPEMTIATFDRFFFLMANWKRADHYRHHLTVIVTRQNTVSAALCAHLNSILVEINKNEHTFHHYSFPGRHFHKCEHTLVVPPLPLRAQDGDLWGWEVSSVPHSTFWPLRVYHPGTVEN